MKTLFPMVLGAAAIGLFAVGKIFKIEADIKAAEQDEDELWRKAYPPARDEPDWKASDSFRPMNKPNRWFPNN